MNALDGAILALALWAAFAGFRTGLAQRVLAWVGFLLGVWVGSRLVPVWVDPEEATSATKMLKVLGTVLGGGMVGQILGSLLGIQVKKVLTAGGLGRADTAGGVVVGLLGVVVTVWFLAPAIADVPGWPARQARNSALATSVHGLLGPPPDLLASLSDQLGVRGVPEVFDSLRGAPDVPVPPDSPVPDDVVLGASASVLRVSGPACGRELTGSGWVVAPDLVVTNAHVVAGTESVEVEASDGSRWAGVVVAFDPETDLAVLRVRGLDRAPLAIDPAARGDAGVLMGYPGGGGIVVEPFVVADLLDARGEDIYGRRGVERRVLVLGAKVEPGDSGGPLIDADGEVAGVVFAVAPDRPGVAYAIRTEALRPLLDRDLPERVEAGPCI